MSGDLPVLLANYGFAGGILKGVMIALQFVHQMQPGEIGKDAGSDT